MTTFETITATKFKATCLEILDRINRRELEGVAITKRGRVVAVLGPPEDEAARVEELYGLLRGTVLIPPEIDLTAPILDEALDAAAGTLHR